MSETTQPAKSAPELLSSVDRTLRVLEAFAVEKRWSISGLERHLGINRSVVFRLLRSLEIRGYVERVGDKPVYQLGPAAHSFAGAVHTENSTQAWRRHLVRLAEQSGLIVLLYALRGHRYACIERITLNSSTPVTVELGDTIGLHAGAGRAILAHQSSDFIQEVLDLPLSQYTADTPVAPVKIGEALARIRKDGFAMSQGEITPGTIGISVPVENSKSRVSRALCVTFESDHLSAERLQYLVSLLRGTAMRLSEAFADD